MSKSNFNTKAAIIQVAEFVIGMGAIFGGIWVICRVVNALLTLAGVA